MWPSCVCPVICEASTGVCGWTCNLEGEQTWKDSNINEVQFWAPAVLCWIAFPRIENTIDILLFRRVVSTEILHIIHLDIVQESSLIFIITCPGHSTKTISLLLSKCKTLIHCVSLLFYSFSFLFFIDKIPHDLRGSSICHRDISRENSSPNTQRRV